MGDEKPSVKDLLRARYKQIYRQINTGAPPTLFVSVGQVSDGANGVAGLLVEYHEPDWLQTQDLDKKWRGNTDPRAEIYAACEQLAQCCVDVWERDDEHGQEVKGFKGRWQPGLALGEGPVAFARAAQEYGLPAEDGLQAVTAVLISDWEIKRHVELLSVWEPAPPEVGDQFLGESQAATPAA